MAANTKGKRKVKGKTLDLNSFLAEDQDAPSGFAVVQPRRIDWADAMDNEDMEDRFTMDYKKEDKVVILPTVPKSARGPDVDVARIPNEPPFTAFLGNLPYDISEDDIANFFRQLQVKNVRLPRDGGDKGRIKGFGYAEFDTRQDLVQALALSNESLKNRAVKISLAGDQDGDRGDRRNAGPDRTLGDWRASDRKDEPSRFSRDEPSRNDSYQAPRGGAFSDRDSYRPRSGFESSRDFGSSRDRFERNGGDRYERNDYGSRDFGGGRDSDRFERRNDRGYGFSDRGMGGGRGGGREERRDNFGRDSGRDGYNRDMRSSDRDYPPRESYDRRPPPERAPYEGGEGAGAENRERRKLQLAPRTKPIEPVLPPAQAVASSSIFGGAKPVDTAAREREIEARLAREKDPGLVKDPKERESEVRVRKFSSGSGVSRHSSDSGPPDEVESVPSYKPPIPKQSERDIHSVPRPRQLSTGSNESDRDQPNDKASHPPVARKESSGLDENPDEVPRANDEYESVKSGHRSARHNHARRDNSIEKVPHGATYEEPKPPVYTSANKFSHLMADSEDVDKGSTSD